MTTIGEGMLRVCCGCFIQIGCYQPKTSEQCDCDKPCDKVCPDTPEVSHGICDICLEKARSKK